MLPDNQSLHSAQAPADGSGKGGVCIVILTRSPEADAVATLVENALAHRPHCTGVRLETSLVELDPAAAASLITSGSEKHGTVACIGYREAGTAALVHGATLRASRIVAIAPAAIPARLRIPSEVATTIVLGGEADADAVRRALPSAKLVETGLFGGVLGVAIEHCGLGAGVVEALCDPGAELSLPDLANRWRQRVGYRIELDSGHTYQDAGGSIHLAGTVKFTGTDGSALLHAALSPLRIGGRVRMAGGELVAGLEGRGALLQSALGVADGGHFRLSVPGFDPAQGHGFIEVALVSEGRFWFSDLGFDAVRLSTAADAVSAAASRPEVASSRERSAAEVSEQRRRTDRNAPERSAGSAPVASCTDVPGEPEFTEDRNEPRSSAMSQSVPLENYKRIRAGTSAVATLDDLWNCYRLLLDREPDEGGFTGYSAIVQRGLTVDELVRMFLSSPEFARRVKAPADTTITQVHLDDFALYVPQADAVVGEELLANRTYEPHVTAAFTSVLREGNVVVDVGANVGYFTMLAATKVGSNGKVIAFEPLARNVRLLLANARFNRAEQVRIMPFGAGDSDGFVTLLSIGSIASSREVTIEDLTTANAFEFAYAQKIDTVLAEETAVDIIKIDIDGFDHKAMLGAERTLTRFHPHIFAEYAPGLLAQFSGIAPIEYLRFLRQCGYDDFTILRRDGPPLAVGKDIERIAAMPEEFGATHVDLHVRRG